MCKILQAQFSLTREKSPLHTRALCPEIFFHELLLCFPERWKPAMEDSEIQTNRRGVRTNRFFVKIEEKVTALEAWILLGRL
jgi:hypothetical protein